MKIGLHSDLHTEFSLCTIPNLQDLDVLLLGGDIGDPATVRLFFDYIRRKAPNLPVLYVLGNHEFFGFALCEARAMYRAISEEFDVIMLDDESVVIDEVLFIGSTLWTDFTLSKSPEASKSWAQDNLNDFRYIHADHGDLLSASEMAELHQKSRAFITQALQQSAQKKVVLTHFLPRKELISKKHRHGDEQFIKSSYWTNHLPELNQADIWAYGHSHANVSAYLDGTQFVSNQRGYSKIFDAKGERDYQQDYFVLL